MSEEKRDYQANLVVTPGEIKFAERAIMAEQENRRLQQEVSEFLRLNIKYQKENADLRAQLALSQTEIESWHSLCEAYLANIKNLEAQNADLQAQVGVLRDMLENLLQAIADGESCREYVNGELANYIGNAVDPESDAVNEAERILSLTPTRAGEQVRRLEAVAEAAKNCRKACRQLDDDIEAGIYSYIGDDTPLDESNKAIEKLDSILAELGGEPE